jgi:hypothetical protein
MRVPIQNKSTEQTDTEQSIEILSQSVLASEALEKNIDKNEPILPGTPSQESAESQEGADNMQMSTQHTPDTSESGISKNRVSPSNPNITCKIKNIKKHIENECNIQENTG